MFKIGDFSRLSKVTVKTLRYYADIGLLPPARVDAFTDYRYYTIDQLPRLNRILALRDLGFTLEQIGRILDDHLTAEQLRRMLRLRRAEIEHQLDLEHSKLAQVEQRLLQIEMEDNMSDFDIVLKQREAVTVASLRDTVPDYTQVGGLFHEMFQYLGQNGVIPAGPPGTFFHDPEFKEAHVDVEVAVPVGAGLPQSDRIKLRDIPAVEQVATCAVHGSYDQLHQTYEALGRWIEANQYQVAGPPCEIYLRGPESTDNPDEYLTEIQFPVTKAIS